MNVGETQEWNRKFIWKYCRSMWEEEKEEVEGMKDIYMSAHENIMRQILL